MVTMEEVKRVKAAYEAELMGKSGVVALAIGYRYVDGEKTDELCIICYVVKKKSIEELKGHEIIPREIEGVPIDIVESGRIRAL